MRADSASQQEHQDGKDRAKRHDPRKYTRPR
jgi:hypothetical protein